MPGERRPWKHLLFSPRLLEMPAAVAAPQPCGHVRKRMPPPAPVVVEVQLLGLAEPPPREASLAPFVPAWDRAVAGPQGKGEEDFPTVPIPSPLSLCDGELALGIDLSKHASTCRRTRCLWISRAAAGHVVKQRLTSPGFERAEYRPDYVFSNLPPSPFFYAKMDHFLFGLLHLPQVLVPVF